MAKAKYGIEWHREHGTRFLDKLPEGWQYVKGATTAPNGWEWACNGESRFYGNYENALVRQRG